MPTPGKVLVDGSTGDVLTIPAPSAGGFIRVFSCQLTVSATSTVTLKSGSTTVDKAYLGVGNSYNRTSPVSGFLDCNPGDALVIGNSAGTIAGELSYAVIPCTTSGPQS